MGTGYTREVDHEQRGRLHGAPAARRAGTRLRSPCPGSRPGRAQNLSLHVNDRIQLDMMLKTGGITETVEVTAAAQMIQPTAAVQTLMGADPGAGAAAQQPQLRAARHPGAGRHQLPADEVGIGLASNVSISINGQRRNAVNWLVDGAGNVDVGSNITLLNTPTLESIEEFKIITSSYAAEWPRSGGGIINVVTKSGTNDLRFVGYEFFRNDALNANSFFRKQTGCQTGGTCLDRSADGATNFAGAGRTRQAALQQLRLHGRRAHHEGQAVLLLLAGMAPDRARAHRPQRQRARPGLADGPHQSELRGARAARPGGGAAAVAVPRAEPGDQPVPQLPAQRAGHPPGGGARGLA